MPNLDPEVAQRINAAAQELSFARKALEKARNFEEQKIAQVAFDQAQERMVNAGMLVNRGMSRDTSAA